MLRDIVLLACAVLFLAARKYDPTKLGINWIFTHVGLGAHAHNNYCARG